VTLIEGVELNLIAPAGALEPLDDEAGGVWGGTMKQYPSLVV
jgi:hypothetical protein